MKIGDKVRLNEQGKKMKVEEMQDWEGTVVGFRGPNWVNVVWEKAANKCKACNGAGHISQSWEEHRDFIAHV